MQDIIELLKGKKTYIVAGIAGLLMALNLLGYISQDTLKTLLELCGVGGLVTVRSAIASSKEE